MKRRQAKQRHSRGHNERMQPATKPREAHTVAFPVVHWPRGFVPLIDYAVTGGYFTLYF